MSRLGKTPIKKPQGVEITVSKNILEVKGPKGALTLELMEGILIEEVEGFLQVEIAEKKSLHKKFHGLYRALVNNMVVGVSAGFQKRLQLIGVGFRAEMSGNKIKLSLGYSNPIFVAVPTGIEIKLQKPTEITVLGIDKQQVGQFADKIRSFRKPEPYKGKGVRYEGEYVRKKAGKGAK